MADSKPMSTMTKLAIDFGPLLVFFLVSMKGVGDGERLHKALNFGLVALHLKPILESGEILRAVASTVAFMIATAVSIVVSKIKTGEVSKMLWITGAIVLVMGALTVYFRDENFIRQKPTVVYATFAGVLFFSLLTNRLLLKAMLEAGFPEMSDAGWRALSRNWAWFFVGMTVLNAILGLKSVLSFDQWVMFKVWGATTMSFVFALAQAPVLMKHGIDEDVPPPPTQG